MKFFATALALTSAITIRTHHRQDASGTDASGDTKEEGHTLRGELDNLWGEIDSIWQFIVDDHQEKTKAVHHDDDEGREHDEQLECSAFKNFLMNLLRAADNDESITISPDELHEAVGWTLMPDEEIEGMMGMIWGLTDADADGSVTDEELKGLYDLIGGDMSNAEWGMITAFFAFADASGNQNGTYQFGEIVGLVKEMRDGIHSLGGVQGVFDMLDANTDGEITGMEWEQFVMSIC